jgi:hypothetical protein
MIRYAFRSVGITAFLICALAGCVREPAISASPSPSSTPTDTVSLEADASPTLVVTGTVGVASPTPGTRVPGATRLPGATPTPIVVQAKSARATMGKAYTFQLSTRCGIDYSVDFDGSFWDASGTRPAGIGNPIQKGTITLIDTRHARFSYDKGTISYTRHIGVKTIPYRCG